MQTVLILNLKFNLNTNKLLTQINTDKMKRAMPLKICHQPNGKRKKSV